MVDFLKQDGITPTPEGEAVLTHMRSAIQEADDPNDKLKINQLSGPVRDFWVKVVATKAISEAEYLRDYPYAVGAVYALVQEQVSAQAQAQAAQESHSALVNELKALRERVDTQATELAALKEARKPVASAKKDKAGQEAEGDAESEA